MITKFKIFENKIGISFINPNIKNILSKYDISATLGYDNVWKLKYKQWVAGSIYVNDEIDICTTSECDLLFFFNAIDRLKIEKNKIIKLKDEICEYEVREINVNLFFKLKNFMSDKLIKDLENDKEIGPIILSKKYNI